MSTGYEKPLNPPGGGGARTYNSDYICNCFFVEPASIQLNIAVSVLIRYLCVRASGFVNRYYYYLLHVLTLMKPSVARRDHLIP